MIQHQFAQAFVQNVGVNFGRRDIGVAQQRLDRPQVGTARQKVRGKGVAQGVRRDFGRRNTTRDGQILDQSVKALPRDVACGPA